MRGRKPTPPRLRMITGQSVPGSPLPPSSGGPGEPPRHLTGAQRAVWNEIVATAPPGLLQACDRLLLESVCVQTVKVRRLAAEIEEKGLVQRDRSHGGMERTAQHVKAHGAAVTLLAKLCTALGITPQARSGIYITPPEGPKSEFEKLMDG